MSDAYKQAAQAARAAIFSPDQPDAETLMGLVEKALALAPERDRYIWQRYRSVLAAGRTIRTKTVAVEVTSLEGVDAALVRDLESAFEGSEP